MTQNKTPPHIKLDEHIHIKKPLFSHLDRLGWDIIPLMQNLFTDKVRVTPLLTEPQEAGA